MLEMIYLYFLEFVNYDVDEKNNKIKNMNKNYKHKRHL